MKEINNSYSFEEISEQIEKVFGINGRIGITYYVATLFKKEIIEATGHFPILIINGNTGTGKSQLAKTISAFGKNVIRPMILPNRTSRDIFQSINENPDSFITLDQYTNKISKRLYDTLAGLDGSNEFITWGRKKIETSKGASVILTGKDIPTLDERLLTRSICIAMQEREYDDYAKKIFLELCKERDNGFSYKDYIKERCCVNPKGFFNRFDMNMIVHAPRDSYWGKTDTDTDLTINWMILITVHQILYASGLLPCSSDINDFCEIAIQKMISQDEKLRKITE